MLFSDFTTIMTSLLLAPALTKPTPPAGLSMPAGLSTNPQAHLPIEQSDSKPANCAVDPYFPPPISDQQFPPFDQDLAVVYRYRQQQGVNLGSWFVHENWMTPSLFACASDPQAAEIDLATGWGDQNSAQHLLERHWDEFINETDFAYLQSIGINTVRLPIGYWTLGPDFCSGTPFEDVSTVYQNSWPRVVRAINWAARYGIGVLIDLHGAPGSQNGQSHSGISDGIANLFNNEEDQQKTIAVLVYLAQQLSQVTNVVGIQLLNEPNNAPNLPDFYDSAISAIRQISTATQNLPLYIHDGFDLNRFSTYIAQRQDFVVQDHHSYFVFTPSDDSESASDHTSDIKGDIAAAFASAARQERRNLVIDEWSSALTPDSLSVESDQDQARRAFGVGQLDMYSNTSAGWAFWSYRLEGCASNEGWCFRQAVGNSIPPTFFSYPGATSYVDPSEAPDGVGSELSQIQPNTTNGSAASAHARRSTVTTLFERSQKRSTFERYSHQQTLKQLRRLLRERGDDSETPSSISSDISTTQEAVSKGYLDGFETAKIFASHGMSRLGFSGQYIADSADALFLSDGLEDPYQGGFTDGWREGEGKVASFIVTWFASTSGS